MGELFLLLSVPLAQSLQRQVRLAQLAQLGQLCLDAGVGAFAFLLSFANYLLDSSMICIPLVFFISFAFFPVLSGIKARNKVFNFRQFFRIDLDHSLTVISLLTDSAFQNMPVVTEMLCIRLRNNVCGLQNAPGIIDTAPVIIDGFRLRLVKILHVLAELGFWDGAVKSHVDRALVDLVQDLVVVSLSHEI